MKMISLFLLLAVSAATFSQQTDPSPTLTKQDYLQKSKKQKTAAWLLLGGGTVVGFVGLTQLNFAGSIDGQVNNTPGTVLFFTGVAAVITSIPIHSSAKRNRKKALNMSFKMQESPQLQKTVFVKNRVPSLSLKVGL